MSRRACLTPPVPCPPRQANLQPVDAHRSDVDQSYEQSALQHPAGSMYNDNAYQGIAGAKFMGGGIGGGYQHAISAGGQHYNA